MKNSSESFNADYYERGVETGVSCYKDYRWLPDLTLPMAKAMVAHLGIKADDTILDFGCAKGFLVKALRLLGHQAFGADISCYAVESADESVRPFLEIVEPGQVPHNVQHLWDWIIAKDVLEHLTEDEIRDVLRGFYRAAKRAFVVVPLGDGEKFVIPEMELDVTHKTRHSAEWWIAELHVAGFNNVRWEHAMAGIKDNWTSRYPEGNGFFFAE